jgi:hypothetical protein
MPSICELERFMPGLGPGMPFRLREFPGSRWPLDVGPLEGEFEAVSSAAAALTGACAVESRGELAGDEGVRGRISEGNLASRLDGKRRIIIRVLTAAAAAAAFDALGMVA